MHPMLMRELAIAHIAALLGQAERNRLALPAPREVNGRNTAMTAGVGTRPMSYGRPRGPTCENSVGSRGPSWSGGP